MLPGRVFRSRVITFPVLVNTVDSTTGVGDGVGVGVGPGAGYGVGTGVDVGVGDRGTGAGLGVGLGTTAGIMLCHPITPLNISLTKFGVSHLEGTAFKVGVTTL